MSAPHIRCEHETLGQVSKMFSKQSSETQRTSQKLNQAIETLQGGDWVGRGATAFYQEMDSAIMPSIRRLAEALEMASRTTTMIGKVMEEADDEASRLLQMLLSAGGAIAAGVAAAVGGLFGGGEAGAGAAAGGGAGAATGQAAWQQANPLLSRDPNSLFSDSNMRGMIGSEFQGAGGELGNAMNRLLNNPSDAQVAEIIVEISILRNRPPEEMMAEYEKFKEVQAQQEASGEEKPPSLGGGHSSFMGSNTQMRYGSVVGDAFGIDPVFGAMLNPTGGLVGPGNWAIAGDDTAVGYHGVVHDAAGYLHNYHNTGPGYDYLGSEGRDTSSPLSGQRDGIRYWRDATGGPSPISAPAEWVMRGVVGGIDMGSELIAGMPSIF